MKLDTEWLELEMERKWEAQQRHRENMRNLGKWLLLVGMTALLVYVVTVTH